MTNIIPEITNAITPINGLDVVKQVNDFYSTSFTQLLVFFSIVSTIGCVVIPILAQWYQKNQLKIREKELALELKRLVEEKTKKFVAEMDKKFEEEKKTIASSLAENVTLIEKRATKAEGYVFQLQGNGNIERGDYVQSCIDYLAAARSYCKCNNGSNLPTILNILSDKILPKLNMEQLKEDGLSESIAYQLEEVSKTNHNGFLDVLLIKTNEAFRKAKERRG
ncbi:MAG TPA: hypothetical protein VH413_18710 [Verrucomicrobiae bacterium]|jgi:hypothetical protein|nr:hypothetical protein [Verrucomicrobiae bacterium]